MISRAVRELKHSIPQKTTASGTVNYVYDIAGQQVAEVNSSGTLNRAEVYAGGWHLATYTNSTTYFNHADWLGTERMRTEVSGTSCETIVSLAFGDGQVTSGSCDPTPMHFTGKQRDTETNLDDFDARYYSSQWGRFISADWSAVPVPVPYANLANPQTPNLYGMVSDSPETFTDPDGHILQLVGDVVQDGRALCDLAGDDCNDLGFQTLNGVTTVTFTCGTYSTTACDELTAAGQLIKAAVFSPDLWVFGASYFDFSSYNYTMYHAQTTTVLGEAEDKIALWSGIAKNFGRNFVSPKFYREEFSPGGCLRTFVSASADALNPLSPSLSSGGDAAAAALAAKKFNAALTYAASRPNYLGGTGLIYPTKSRVFVGMVNDAKATAASGALLSFDLALAQGFGKEMYELATGTCH